MRGEGLKFMWWERANSAFLAFTSGPLSSQAAREESSSVSPEAVEIAFFDAGDLGAPALH